MANKDVRMTKLKNSKLRTPKGIARYAYIDRPDDSTYGKNRFRCTVVFPDYKTDPEFKAFVKGLKALAKQHAEEIGKPAKNAKIPIKLVDEKMSKGKDGKSGTGDAVGTPYIAVEANSQVGGRDVNIPTFNQKGQEEVLSIFGGAIVRVECRFMGWLLEGDHGVKGYMNAVQQLKASPLAGSSSGSSFEVEDEYLEDDDDDTEADNLDDEDGSSFEGDDDDFSGGESDDPDLTPEPEGDEDEDEGDDPLAGLV